MTAKVLYVDDEPGNLVVFKAQFKKLMEIRTASSGAEALDILAREEIPVVLADQRMPGMSGAELLSEVRRKHPHAVRMIVTAYTDFDQVVRSINESHVERYITKPWDPSELHSVITGACELYEKEKENRTLTEDVLHKERLVAIGAVTLGLVKQLETIGKSFEKLENIEARPADEARAGLDLFQGGVHELTAVLRGLRLYSRRGLQEGMALEIEDLNAIVAKSSEILRLFPVAKRASALAFEPSPAPLLVNVDEERLKQVIVNLALHLLASSEPETASLVLRTRADDGSAVVALQGQGLQFSQDSADVLRDGLLAKSDQTRSGFWLLLAQKVLGDHGGEIRGSGEGEILQLRLPLHA